MRRLLAHEESNTTKSKRDKCLVAGDSSSPAKRDPQNDTLAKFWRLPITQFVDCEYKEMFDNEPDFRSLGTSEIYQ